VPNPQHKPLFDSFVLELKRAMGSNYIDLNELRYYRRSDRRADPFWDEKAKKFKTMKNAGCDIEILLRNRDIDRCVKAVKLLYEIKGLPWNEDIEEEWDRRIVQFVNPKTVCKGRSFEYEQRDRHVTDERYASPEPLERKIIEPPVGMHEDDLGGKYFWSEKEGRMVSMEESRQQRSEILESDMIFQSSSVVVFEGISTRSKSKSPSKDSVERGTMN
jgi:hypothetical protein